MGSDSYSNISTIYNDLVRHVNYSGWADYLNELIAKYQIKTDFVLELASGTGRMLPAMKLSSKLTILSYKSFRMIDQAPADAVKMCLDMTEIPFKQKFDLVISCFDSVNHLSTRESLIKFFNEVKRVLVSGGYLLFDIVTEQNSYAYVGSYSKKRKQGNLIYQQASNYDPVRKIHKNSFVINLPDNTKIEEDNYEYIYSTEMIDELLKECKFTIMKKFEAFTLKGVSQKTFRIQYVTRSMDDTGV